MLTFRNMYKTALIGLLVACSFTAAAKDSDPVAARIAAQNALFEEQYQADLKTHPERATAIGDYRYNDQLEDFSPAAYQRQDATDKGFLSRLNAISTAGFPEQDKLSHEVMQRFLVQRIANFKFKEYEMPVNQMEGPQVALGGPAARGSARLGQALRGLHCAAASDSARPRPVRRRPCARE